MNSQSLTILEELRTKVKYSALLMNVACFHYFLYISGSDICIQKSHCGSETNNRFQKNLSRACKQLRFVKCHASIVWPCIQQTIVIKREDPGPLPLGIQWRL